VSRIVSGAIRFKLFTLKLCIEVVIIYELPVSLLKIQPGDN